MPLSLRISGRLFSVHMIFDVITTTGIPVYSIIFEKTMDKFAATFFLLSMPANFVSTVLYRYLSRNQPTYIIR